MRCEFNDGSLEKAIDWFGKSYMFLVDRKRALSGDFDLEPISVSEYKHSPAYWDWDFFKSNNFIIIDDQTQGVPLKRAVMTDGWMVDWDEVDSQFKENNIY